MSRAVARAELAGAAQLDQEAVRARWRSRPARRRRVELPRRTCPRRAARARRRRWRCRSGAARRARSGGGPSAACHRARRPRSSRFLVASTTPHRGRRPAGERLAVERRADDEVVGVVGAGTDHVDRAHRVRGGVLRPRRGPRSPRRSGRRGRYRRRQRCPTQSRRHQASPPRAPGGARWRSRASRPRSRSRRPGRRRPR